MTKKPGRRLRGGCHRCPNTRAPIVRGAVEADVNLAPQRAKPDHQELAVVEAAPARLLVEHDGWAAAHRCLELTEPVFEAPGELVLELAQQIAAVRRLRLAPL